MHVTFSFSINLKGKGSQEERRGGEENGKREGKGISKCSLLLLSNLLLIFLKNLQSLVAKVILICGFIFAIVHYNLF